MSKSTGAISKYGVDCVSAHVLVYLDGVSAHVHVYVCACEVAMLAQIRMGLGFRVRVQGFDACLDQNDP